jgi:hypothetical protein
LLWSGGDISNGEWRVFVGWLDGHGGARAVYFIASGQQETVATRGRPLAENGQGREFSGERNKGMGQNIFVRRHASSSRHPFRFVQRAVNASACWVIRLLLNR